MSQPAENDAPTVTGECLCHGVIVTGTVGTVAQPGPYFHADFWSGKRIKCVAVMVVGTRMPHDVPVKGLRVIPPGEDDAPDCRHEHVRTLRSIPHRSECLDCGATVERQWVRVIPPDEGETSPGACPCRAHTDGDAVCTCDCPLYTHVGDVSDDGRGVR